MITEAGYGELFLHRTGHGLGLSVHEEPYITSVNELVLEEGMTFTIEPGIYIEGVGGVRIEDDILVTKRWLPDSDFQIQEAGGSDRKNLRWNRTYEKGAIHGCCKTGRKTEEKYNNTIDSDYFRRDGLCIALFQKLLLRCIRGMFQSDRYPDGALGSAYGSFAVIAYFLGGFCADRWPAKKLLTLSLVSTGVMD